MWSIYSLLPTLIFFFPNCFLPISVCLHRSASRSLVLTWFYYYCFFVYFMTKPRLPSSLLVPPHFRRGWESNEDAPGPPQRNEQISLPGHSFGVPWGPSAGPDAHATFPHRNTVSSVSTHPVYIAWTHLISATQHIVFDDYEMGPQRADPEF